MELKILLFEIIPGTVAGEWHGLATLTLTPNSMYLFIYFFKEGNKSR